MKQTQKISAVIMMFLLIGVLLLTSFQVAIYGLSLIHIFPQEQPAEQEEYCLLRMEEFFIRFTVVTVQMSRCIRRFRIH